MFASAVGRATATYGLVAHAPAARRRDGTGRHRQLRVCGMAGQKDGMGGPKNRTGRTHDPYSTPLRDGNRDRLYGMLTARAAATLLTYLTEMNKAGASFFMEYMVANRIPYAYGEQAKIADISGETFITGLLTMGPVHIDEKYRDNYGWPSGTSTSPIWRTAARRTRT
mmetsp:Transcript_13129/g.21338  ORF Transcript_13129/g.21338 Transcript_13129/m.21338 type:complete len:168 (-) Transcript_13129:613-1116(-)